jgi:catechol 2,3-dioxygenase-like lactoylglutathione lyase family enzyme
VTGKIAFNKIMPVLRVADLQRAVDWYIHKLGFEVSWRLADEGDGETCLILAGDTSVLLSTGSHLGGTPCLTGTLYFEMSGVAAYYERIKQQVENVWPLSVMDYGTLEFGIRDSDGYVLAFAEERGPEAA